MLLYFDGVARFVFSHAMYVVDEVFKDVGCAWDGAEFGAVLATPRDDARNTETANIGIHLA